MTDDLLVRLLDKVENRYYGKYRGIVEDNKDPETRGRIRVRIPSVLGNDVISGWALPCSPYGGAAAQGFFFIPEEKAAVWVEFEGGNLDYPIWVGTFWAKPGGESEVPKPNQPDGTEESSVQDPPTRKIIKTLKGHTIQLEDKDDEEMILIKEATNNHVVTLDKDGIKITDGANGQTITMNADGIVMQDATKNEIQMKTDAFTIVAKVPFKIDASGQAITIVGTTIDLNKG